MRIRAVMVRILFQLKGDRRTIALLIFAPMMVLTLMALIFNGTDYHPKIAVINLPQNYIMRLEDNDVNIIRLSEAEADTAVKNTRIDAVVRFKNGAPDIVLEGSDPGKNKAVLALMQSVTQQMMPGIKPEVTYLYGYENMSAFDNFGPIFIGFFVFFFVFLIAGTSFLRERTTGTLERVLATPIRRWEIVFGYILGFGFFTALQSSLVAWYAINVLNIMMVGSFGLVIFITILTAMVALTVGMFISAYANNELQMIQFIPIIVVPQVFFSGLFDLSTMPSWLAVFGQFMPLWYVADALRNIMIRGKGWHDIVFDVYVLVIICIFFIIANILALRKYRKI